MSARLPVLDRSSAPSLPYPRGWYVVANSDDVDPLAVRVVQAFGGDLVVFRAEDGEVHVTHAYCPHLGAHLGHGGTVVGDRIRCPFHGWEFEGGSGKCMKAAHGDPPPPKAAIKPWHVDERDGMILVWFHDQGAAPDHQLPPQPEFDLAWSPWRIRTWECPARIQDVGENDTDVSHSPVMHGITDELPTLTMQTEGVICNLTMQMKAKRESFGLPDFPRLLDLLRVPKTIDAEVEVRRSGFSIGLIRQTSSFPGGLELRTQTLISTTPIDERHVRIIARHRVGATPFRPLTTLILNTYAGLFDRTIEEDFEIWEHKIYRMRPMAAKSDWAVIKFRKWARQFYAEGVCEAALRLEDELREAGSLP